MKKGFILSATLFAFGMSFGATSARSGHDEPDDGFRQSDHDDHSNRRVPRAAPPKDFRAEAISSDAIQLTWRAAGPGTTGYLLLINPAPWHRFLSPFRDEDDCDNDRDDRATKRVTLGLVTSYTVRSLRPGQLVAFRLCSLGGKSGHEQSEAAFAMDMTPPGPFTITAPAAGATTVSNPTITWSRSEGALFYDVVVASDGPSCKRQVAKVSRTRANSFQPGKLKDGTYYVCVESGVLDPDATATASNSGLSFKVGASSSQIIVSAGAPAISRKTFSQVGSVSASVPVTLAWTKVSGPGALTFAPANAATTNISANADGVYVIMLTATDGSGKHASATTTVTWDTAAPVISPIPDLVARESRPLSAEATDATAVTFAWTQVSGPGNLSFSTSPGGITTVSASVDGTYAIRVTATDEVGNASSVNAKLLWDSTPPHLGALAPIITNTSRLVVADVSDLSAVSLQWVQTSGPGTLHFSAPAAAATNISADQDGIYSATLTATDVVGNVAQQSLSFSWDTGAPIVSAGPDVIGRSGLSLAASAMDANAMTFDWSTQSGPTALTFLPSNGLTPLVLAPVDGIYRARITATDAAGNASTSTTQITWDATRPSIVMGPDVIGGKAVLTVSATVTDLTPVVLAWSAVSGPGAITFGSADGRLTTVSASADGVYELQLSAVDAAGNTSTGSLHLTWIATPPSVSLPSGVSGNTPQVITATATGGSALTYHWQKDSGPGSVSFSSDSTLSTTVSADQVGAYVLRFTATDLAGNSTSATTSLTWTGTEPLPPLPGPDGIETYSEVDFQQCLKSNFLPAPQRPQFRQLSFFDSVRFLFTGDQPVQIGMTTVPDSSSISVVRGRIMALDATPIADADIRLVDHPEYGSTKTGPCGDFFLAIPGDKMQLLRFSANGYLAAEVSVFATSQGFAWAPTTILVHPDANVTQVTFAAINGAAVARGAIIDDELGTRRATLIINGGTSASVVRNGSQVALASLSLRLTEKSIGSHDLDAMPRNFLLSIGADEVSETEVVSFSQPVALYAEDYLNAPAGAVLGAQFYDFSRHIWASEPDGRVIAIINVDHAVAAIDVDGDGIADSGAALSALGIGDAELRALGTLYTAGQKLMRWPKSHLGSSLFVPKNS